MTITSGMGVIRDPSALFDYLKSYAQVISIKDPRFGAVGDYNGTTGTDNTNAIIAALEYANSVAKGTWKTGGDTTNGTPRQRVAVFVPPGKYRTTSTIPIRFENVSIVGAVNETDGGSDWGGWTSTIVGDFAGDVFNIDSTYNAYYTNFKYLAIRKTAAYANQGNGISVTGANWIDGLSLKYVSIRGLNNGVSITTTTSTIAEVYIEHCALGANNNYGFYCIPAITIGRIEKSNISQNTVGGIYTGVKGFAILDNDMEGQPNPIVIQGTNNQKLRVEGNYFEANQAGTACITANLLHGFRIENNQFGPNITIPNISLTTCTDGYVDDYAIMTGCHNVLSGKGGIIPGSSTYYGQSLNLSSHNLPAQSTDVLPNAAVLNGGASNVTIGGKYFEADQITTNNVIRTGNLNFTAGQYVGFAYAIKYTNTLPSSGQQVLVYGFNTSTSAFEQIATVGLDVSNSLIVGDTAVCIGGFQCPTGKTYSQLRLYIYPYASDATTGTGAYLTRPVAWVQTSNTFNNVNPLVYLGTVDLYATAPLTFGAIAANSAVEQTVTVNGATVNDAAFASPSTSVNAGLLWSAYVSAANTITVRLANLTTASITPTAGSQWNVGVIQRQH